MSSTLLEALEVDCPDKHVGRQVRLALSCLLKDDHQLLSADAAERTIAGALMIQLTTVFRDWNVDVEYNKMGDAAKKVAWNSDPALVYPDVIVHMRGTKRNLLAIELKKSTNGASKDDDVRKLQAYRTDAELAYQHCLFLRIGTEAMAGAITEFEWV